MKSHHHISFRDLLWFAVCMTAVVVIGTLRLIRDWQAIDRAERVCIPAPMLHWVCPEDVE
jgi:hypothetical protein